MKRFILLIFLSILSIITFAEPVDLDEKTAIELALKNNYSLKRERVNSYISEVEKKSYYNVFYPKIQGRGTISNLNTPKEVEINTPAGPMSVEAPPTNLILGLEASIFLTPAMIDGIKLLESNAQLSDLKVKKSEGKVIKETKVSFYTLVLLKEQIKLLEANIRALENRYDQVYTNYSAGYVDELTLLEVEVALEGLKPQLNKLNQAYTLSIENIKMFLGLDRETDINIVGEINIDNQIKEYDTLYSNLLKNNSDIKIANKNIKLLTEQITLKKHTAYYPVLGISYSMSTIYNDPLNFNNFSFDNYTDDQGSLNLFLNMNFAPLFPNSKERVEIKKLENNQKNTELALKELKEGLNLKLIKELQNMENSIIVQDSLNSTIKLAERKLHLTEIAYKQGSKELLEVEQAENDLRKANIDLLNEKFNYLKSQFEIEELTGKGE